MEQSRTQLNVSNGCYVLDQQGNYMFRPLEAIFRLHKIDLEENPPARPPLHTAIRFNALAKQVIMLRSQH